jgi:thioredoxin reductase
MPSSRAAVRCGIAKERSAAALHGFLTRDGTAPLELLRLGRDELSRYGIDLRSATVTAVERGGAHFDVTIDESERVQAQALLIATGVCDQLPSIPGVRELRDQRPSLSILRRLGTSR